MTTGVATRPPVAFDITLRSTRHWQTTVDALRYIEAAAVI